jgi:ADP-ribosylglycohydrolase
MISSRQREQFNRIGGRLMLVELAIGDAYGAGFEYAPVTVIEQHNTASYFVQHPTHLIRPGNYTDDTQMSIAIAEALVSGEPWTPQHLADCFVAVFKRDPHPGYSHALYPILQQVKTGAELLALIHADSDKSGASMRAPPLGVLPTFDMVVERCAVQAAITHNTPAGINAATAAALTTHYFLYDLGPKKYLGQFLNKRVPGEWAKPWQDKVGSKGWMSVRAAITALMRNRRLSELLKDCIAFSGDVDTVASIALAAASASKEYEQDLPENLLSTLENGPYGRDFLAALDKQLLALMSG